MLGRLVIESRSGTEFKWFREWGRDFNVQKPSRYFMAVDFKYSKRTRVCGTSKL
jgi:hypothetical protein